MPRTTASHIKHQPSAQAPVSPGKRQQAAPLRRRMTRRSEAPLASLSERHIAALVREIEADDADNAFDAALMRATDMLLDPGFDEDSSERLVPMMGSGGSYLRLLDDFQDFD